MLRSGLALGSLLLFFGCVANQPPDTKTSPARDPAAVPDGPRTYATGDTAEAFRAADSLERMRAPRSIRGVLTNSATGAPIARAAIVVHSAAMRPTGIGNDVWGKTYTDSLGRYWIFNPPVGSFLLEIQCPPWRYRAGLVMDAPSEYLEPAENKVLNRSSDGRLCNGPTRARRLYSGALESSEARSTLYPSGDAAAVYRAVLDGIFPEPSTSGSSVVLSHITSSHITSGRCGEITSCKAIVREWLSTKEEMDSSTIEDFLEANKRQVPLRADFGYSHHVYLLTEDERRYLVEEAGFYDATFGVSDRGEVPTFWKMFNESYPSARGLVTLSRVGFDGRHSEALVEMSHRTSKRGSGHSTVLLRKTRSSWKVVGRF